MLSDFPPTSSFCTVKCARKEIRSCLGSFHSANHQYASLSEAVMFKHRIQHLLKETSTLVFELLFLCSRKMLTLLFWLL